MTAGVRSAPPVSPEFATAPHGAPSARASERVAAGRVDRAAQLACSSGRVRLARPPRSPGSPKLAQVAVRVVLAGNRRHS